MNRIDHFILTRFNVKVAYADLGTRLDPAWLRHRFELFDRFCYPSVCGQSNQNFRWLVLFDSDTPPIFKEKVKDYSKWNNFIPVYMTASNGERRKITREVIMGYMADGVERIITTRLDNDDAIHRDFVQTLHDSVHDNTVEFINFTYGYVWHQSKIYLTAQASNPFISLVEKADGFRTVYSGVEHTRLSTVAPIREIMVEPLWLQVVHERNVSNRVQGIRKPIKRLHNFAIDRTCIPTRNDWSSCWLERCQDALNRAIRKTFRR